ncbi:MAG: PilZ domain-containing protein [Nitrospirota bacterium]
MSDPAAQPIVIHFKDGRLDRGLLTSSLLTHESLQYCRRGVYGERRSDPRLWFVADVKIDQVTVGRVTDVNARGAFVETLAPYATGTVITMSLRLDADPIDTAARVVFSDPGVGMGVEFLRLTAATRHRVDAALHRLNGASGSGAGRRRGSRRHTPAPGHAPRWDERKQDRRHAATDESPEPIAVDLEQVKSVFFVESDARPEIAGGNSDPLDRQVTVEFRDGETIQGTLRDFAPETVGFFITLRVDERHAHTVYVVKSSVKSLETVF